MHNQPFCFQLTQTMLKHVHYYRISMFWFRERCTRVWANTVFVEPLWRLICSLRHQSITTTPVPLFHSATTPWDLQIWDEIPQLISTLWTLFPRSKTTLSGSKRPGDTTLEIYTRMFVMAYACLQIVGFVWATIFPKRMSWLWKSLCDEPQCTTQRALTKDKSPSTRNRLLQYLEIRWVGSG